MIRLKVRQLLILAILFITAIVFHINRSPTRQARLGYLVKNSPWTLRRMNHPIDTYQQLPGGNARRLPRIQHAFDFETPEQQSTRQYRRRAIKLAFRHTWRGYRSHAWLADELRPLSGESKTTFGNWSATLVDSLDSLWIMGFKNEFDEAVAAVAGIDFETSTVALLNVFETTIRYLGGLLSAYDLSSNEVLLIKAVQLGNVLYAAFDTSNRMPVHTLSWQSVLDSNEQEASDRAGIANIGSMSLEFTRLSQLTGDMKFYDAIQRISDMFFDQQDNSIVPGLWPIWINAMEGDFASGLEFSFGGMADSAYEYIPKMHLLLGGKKAEYSKMYSKFIEAAKKQLFYRPMTRDGRDVLISGFLSAKKEPLALVPSAQHLGCFVGGMVAIGAKTIGPLEDLEIAMKLTDGCFWAYESMPCGIMPETFAAAPCASQSSCPWNESAWHEAIVRQMGNLHELSMEELVEKHKVPAGFTQIIDGHYLLRPEALESIFILYRITGDTRWQDKAWQMWLAIEKATKTDLAFAEVEDVTSAKPKQIDSMESFWTAETLKYLYLIFDEPDLISLDDWVFNTEAHPFRRPQASSWLR